jgi:hypothetical protein
MGEKFDSTATFVDAFGAASNRGSIRVNGQDSIVSQRSDFVLFNQGIPPAKYDVLLL